MPFKLRNFFNSFAEARIVIALAEAFIKNYDMMQKKFFIFSLLFLLGGPLTFLKAMPPKPMMGYGEKGKEENQGKLPSDIVTEQSRRATESGQSSSASLERGKDVSAEDETAKQDSDEEVSFSDEELDEILTEATEAQEHWKAIHIDATTSPAAVQELVDQLERDEIFWESKQERWSFFAEQMEVPEKFQLVINACSETLNILREHEAQLLPKRQRSNTNDSLGAALEESHETISDPMAALSLKKLSDSSSFQGQYHLPDYASLEVRKKIIALEQQAKSLREYAEQRGKRAQQEHQDARNSFVQRLLTQAEDYYQDAISSAKKTASAWEKSEQVHLELMQVSGQKLRRWGQRLKTTWQERAKAWEEECQSVFESIQRQQKIEEIQQRINEAMARKQEVLNQQQLADQEERNEIGATYDSIARKWEVIKNHLNKILEVYQKSDNNAVKTIEEKIGILKERIQNENEHLNRLNTAMGIWKRDYPTEVSRYLETREEPQSDGKKMVSCIYKKHFVGPLLRIEKIFDQDGHLVEEIKMAAEHLAVQLNRGENTTLFIQQLKEDFPKSNFKMEDVFPQNSLYRLCFQPSVSDPDPQKLLNLFDQIKKTIQEKQLAADCYPDLFSTLSSSKEGEGPLKKKVSETEETEEPWAFYSEFGINPPANLFNEDHPAVEIPPSPILLTIVDSGILATHRSFQDSRTSNAILHQEEDDVGEVFYGYNSCAISQNQKGLPKDLHGHGTHIAAIIAGLPHQVTEVEVKVKDEATGKHECNFFPITEACIRGVASIPGMLKLLICKNVEPGVPEDGHFILRTIDCIRYARERGTRVINCSWGRMFNDSQGISIKNLDSLKNALGNPCELLTKNGQDQWVSYDPPQEAAPIVAVTAAGNLHEGQQQEEGNRDNPANQYYPANFNLDNIIAVAASTKQGALAKRSCYGKQSIHVTAPGVAIISASCSGDNIYRVLSGTSMAVPFVSASMPLMMIKFLTLPFPYSCKKLVDHLCEKANKSNVDALQVQEGMLDLAKALEEPPQSPLTRLELEWEEIAQEQEHGKSMLQKKKQEAK